MSSNRQHGTSSVPPYIKPVTCLYTETHDISDHLLHFLGCLTYKERENIFNEDNEIWKQEIQHYVQTELTSTDSDEDRLLTAQNLTRKKRETWKKDCEKELTRVRILHPGELTEVEGSMPENHSTPPSDETAPQRADKYNLERDISIPIIQYKLRGRENGAASNVEERGLDSETKPEERVWGDFPDQKTKLDLLGEDATVNLLSQDRHPDRIKYFHFPSNNMLWAENALARYFNEKRPDRHAIRRELKRAPKTRAYMLLRDPFWRSQLHGGGSAPPHARHMEPICVTACSDINMTDASLRDTVSPQNMVLFMPFLHWETSRQREKYARTIKHTVERDARKRHAHEKVLKQNRTHKSPPLAAVSPKNSSIHPERSNTRIDSFKDAVPEDFFPHLVAFGENRRLKIDKPLGQYLLDAARLFEGMSNYRDKKLIEQYLCGDTPLHPRRTLDQAYHWKLNTTKKRDRDQVVYRATTIPSDGYHNYDRENHKWPHHEDFEIKGDCSECRDRIRKVSRVIMVDQLWMWVLDKKTIITCFPKRYGVNKHDASGVHKAIRRRLEATPQIRTVFDLGLIIFDECTNVFFDRTETDPSQPPVIDIFSKAIGNVMHGQTAAFNRLYKWTEIASKAYRSKNVIAARLEVPLLDINPEGKLQREIKDIIEELDIMLHITKCHRTILKQFVDNAETMLDPYGEYGSAHRKKETSLSLYNKSLRDQQEEKEDRERRQDYNWFMLNADELDQQVEGHITELSELRASAVSTADSVKDLLELKQQQAGVVQAWQAVNQSNETIKQGRSIMMFTLVTIVFLPLSFMSSIFGMNNQEFSGGGWEIRDEMKLMFPVSAAVIVISLFWAYSGWSRDALWAVYTQTSTWLVVKSGLFSLWLAVVKPKQDLVIEATRASERLFNDARKARFDKNREASAQKDAENAAMEAAKVTPGGDMPGRGEVPRSVPARPIQRHQNGGVRDVEKGVSTYQYN
ncbi:hypothetical protein PG990_014678 [Apiospora arundinis]